MHGSRGRKDGWKIYWDNICGSKGKGGILYVSLSHYLSLLSPSELLTHLNHS